MILQALSEDLPHVLNLPDLILIAFLSISITMGAQRGFLRTLISVFGRFASVLGATFLAKQFAPVLARAVVTPIIGDLFAQKAAEYFSSLPADAANALLSEAQSQVTQAAARMAEGVAFLILMSVFIATLSILIRALYSGARMITRIPPFGLLNRAAGAALGLISGVILTLMLIWLTHLICPDLFQPLGYLSPDTIENTLVLRVLLEYFPII